MRLNLTMRRSVTLLAIYAVALHVILLGLAPIALGGSIGPDPFQVICHSVASSDAGGDQTTGKPDLAPGHACEHCNLCSVMAPPEAPDTALAGTIAPAQVLHLLRPNSSSLRAGRLTHARLARGPPRFA